MHLSISKKTFIGGPADSPHTEMEDDLLFHTPPPVTHETQTQQETQPHEEAPMLGGGLREHRDPNRNRLSPSGPRPRKPAPRYRRHSEV